jgi:integrase
MKGSIQKKGNIYYAVIPIAGRRKWFRGGSTKKDAQRILNEQLSEIDNGTYKEIPKMRFKEFRELWFKGYVEGNLKPSTEKGYKDIVEKKLSHFDHQKLSEITTGQLQKYVSERRKNVSAKTVVNEIVVMKLMFRHAKKWGYIKINPAEDVERPRLKETEIEILDPREIEKLIQITDPHYKVAFLTAFLTGLRAGELWALQWGDIDWNSGKIFVRRSVWKGKFQTPKTKKSMRKIDMTQELIYEMKKWKLACPINEYDLVFPGSEGGIANHVNAANRHFYPALRRAGLRQVSFHSLRHSNASMRIQAGQNIKYISEQLGHSTIRTTLDIYGHLFNDVNFTKQQVELLESSFESVRNPLENPNNCSESDTLQINNQLKLL